MTMSEAFRSSNLGTVFSESLDEKTKGHGNGSKIRRKGAAAPRNDNWNNQVRQVNSVSRRPRKIDPSSPFAGSELRDVFVFASSHIFVRGFEVLNSCYFDFGFDLEAIAAAVQLFRDADADKDGRLGVNDVMCWVRCKGGDLEANEAGRMIREAKGTADGGFLSKLDFVRLLIEREMSETAEASAEAAEAVAAASTNADPNSEPSVIVNPEDLLWATFVAMDADRDGWITLEDMKRLCRPLNYEVDDEIARKIKRSRFLTFDDFKLYVETGKIKRRWRKDRCIVG